jgi:elongation factor P hydroxylase
VTRDLFTYTPKIDYKRVVLAQHHNSYQIAHNSEASIAHVERRKEQNVVLWWSPLDNKEQQEIGNLSLWKTCTMRWTLRMRNSDS